MLGVLVLFEGILPVRLRVAKDLAAESGLGYIKGY